MKFLTWAPSSAWLSRTGLCLIAIIFLATSFRWGWTRVETDFPNYYTAAALALRGEPLRQFYDWTWFQRHMNYEGIERQLGGYVPHTPMTFLPVLPLAKLPPQRAKQVWLLLNLGFLAGAVFLLARISSLGPTYIALLAFVCFGSLHTNFLLGQYYVFLLLLLSLSAYLLVKRHELSSGFVLGTIFVLKLYSAPLFLYFIVKRRWQPAVGMALSVTLFSLISVWMFGWADNWFYLNTILPRALDGTFTDPYNPGLGSATALLRRTFIAEPELNPHPALPFPIAFFLLRAVFTSGLLVFSLLAVRRSPEQDRKRDFAWFVVLAFLLSPTVVSYQFVLLLAPVVLIMPRRMSTRSVLLIALLALSGWRFGPSLGWLFPKLWLLLILYVEIGRGYWAYVPFRQAAVAGSTVLTASILVGWYGWHNYQQEPLQQALSPAKIEPAAIYSSHPATSGGSITYQAIGDGRYVVRRANGAAIQTFAFDGHAFHPSILEAGPIFFELVANRHSSICKYLPETRRLEAVVEPQVDPIDPAVSPNNGALAFVAGKSLYVQVGKLRRLVATGSTLSDPAFFPDGDQIAYAAGTSGNSQIFVASLTGGTIRPLVAGAADYGHPAVSPDGKLLAYSSTETGTRQVWVLDLTTGLRRRMTGGNCTNDSPAWQTSTEIIFATDCGRGYGLPALYKVAY